MLATDAYLGSQSVLAVLLGDKYAMTDIKNALHLLRRFGANAHVWLPGVGQLNGLQTANYLLSDASTGLAPVDQYVGRVNDAMGALGPELAGASFSSTTGWSGSTGSVTATGAGAYSTCQNTGYAGISAGKTYVITYSVIVVSGSVSLQFFGSAAQNTNPITVSGTYSQHFTPVEGKNACQPQAGGSGFTGTVSALSIREVTGIHATQSTTANKPRLERGLRNLLTYSQDLSNAAWTKNWLVLAGERLTRTSTVSSCYLGRILNNPTAAIGTTLTLVVKAKLATTGTRIGLRLQGTYPDMANVLFDLATNTVVGTQANAFTGMATSFCIDGAYTLITLTANVGGSALSNCISGPAGVASNAGSWEGAAAMLSDVDIAAMALFTGAYTAAQIQALGGIPLTTSAAASNQTAGPCSWNFDGVNDSFALGGIPFQLSDDFSLISVANTTDTTSVSKTTVCVGNLGSGFIEFSFAGVTGYPRAVFKDDSGAQVVITDATAYPTGAVLVLRKVGSTKTFWVNGVLKGTDSTVLGASSAAAAYIGSRFSAAVLSTSHIGNIWFTGAIKGTLTDAEVVLLSKLAASQVGITI